MRASARCNRQITGFPLEKEARIGCNIAKRHLIYCAEYVEIEEQDGDFIVLKMDEIVYVGKNTALEGQYKHCTEGSSKTKRNLQIRR